MILLATLGILLTILLTYIYNKWKVYSYLLNNFKAPPRHLFYGHLHLFPPNPRGVFETFQNLLKNYGKNYVLVRPILTASLVISDSKDIEVILANPNTKKAKKADFYKTVEPWLGTGLLTSYGEKWFTRRKIITPSFHFSILDDFVEVMSKQSDTLIDHLKDKIGKDEFDIYPIINAFALDVICETSMGVTVDAQSDPNTEYAVTVKKMTRAIQLRIHHPLGKTAIYDYTSAGRYLKQLANVLHSFTDKVIKDRRDQLSSGKNADKRARMNFLDILLHATADGKPLTNEDIREEVDTFMFEGHDTTASGIAFTLYLLSRHPDVQDKVFREIEDTFGENFATEITHKSLNELTYLDMVVKESLRMYPPVPGLGRTLTENTVIGGVIVPAGVEIRIAVYGMQNDPDYYPNPQQFDPERFNPTNSDSKNAFTYIPFSAGGRNCIGQRFALLDLKIAVSKILMSFKLLPGTEIVLQADLILKATNGINIRLEKR